MNTYFVSKDRERDTEMVRTRTDDESMEVIRIQVNIKQYLLVLP